MVLSDSQTFLSILSLKQVSVIFMILEQFQFIINDSHWFSVIVKWFSVILISFWKNLEWFSLIPGDSQPFMNSVILNNSWWSSMILILKWFSWMILANSQQFSWFLNGCNWLLSNFHWFMVILGDSLVILNHFQLFFKWFSVILKWVSVILKSFLMFPMILADSWAIPMWFAVILMILILCDSHNSQWFTLFLSDSQIILGDCQWFSNNS